MAAGAPAPWGGDPSDVDAVAAYHRRVAERWSTPMDEPDPPLTVDDRLRGRLERALERAAAVGLVQLTEAGITDWAYLDALRDLRERGPLPLAVRLFVASGIAEPGRMTRTGDPWLEVEGVKLYADGWLGPRTCALCRPFADRDDAGVLFLDADAIARRADPFAEAGFAIATHAIGDRAIEAALDGYERLYGSDCRVAAPRVEHAQVLRADLVERIATLGVVACIQPSFAVSDAEAARAGLGPDRLEHAYRWDELLAAGARVVTGSDFPIEALEPLTGLQHLVTGVPLDGDPDHPEAPTLRLDVALELMTDAAAGTTVLEVHPRDADLREIHRIEVLEARPTPAATPPP